MQHPPSPADTLDSGLVPPLEPATPALRDPATPTPHPINLALQGGGSHGAFTWGVLDALLEDGRIRIEGVSGASAGAVNAVALAHGFATAHRDKEDPAAAARAALARVWRGVVGLGSLGSFAQGLTKMLLGGWTADQMGASGFFNDAMRQWMSPYQANPLNINPLRKLLEDEIDFAAIAKAAGSAAPRVFVSATHVHTGRAEIFSGKRLTLDAVMASACLPMLYQAVEIDGQDYWDGGYSANPALMPLINHCASADLVLVQLNPLQRPQTPHHPQDIMDRMNELTFNASLLAQMRNIDFINRLLESGRLQEGSEYRHLYLHRIDGGAAMQELSAASKLSTDGAMIEDLFEQGRAAALRWLERHLGALGQRSSIDIRRDYVGRSMPRTLGKPPTAGAATGG